MVKKLFLFLLPFLFIPLFFIPLSADAFGGEVTSPYNMRVHPVLGTQRFHEGVDIGLNENTPVPSIVNGIVDDANYEDSYGYYIDIKTNNGDLVRYAHGNGFPSNIRNGVQVQKGQIIFYSGNTGISTGPHLHVEYHEGADSHTVDPVPILKASGWDLWGNLTADSIFDAEIFHKLDLEMDYTTYFSPSIILTNVGESVLEVVTKIGQYLMDNLMQLLILLMVINLAWYGIKVMTFEENFSMAVILPKLMRYGFFLAICKSWDILIQTLFVPVFEHIATLYAGQTYTQKSFLEFDMLFDGVRLALSHYLHLDLTLYATVTSWGFAFLPFLLKNICVIIILCFCIFMSVMMISKLVKFYLLLGMSILGLPVSFMPSLEWNGKAMLGGVLANILDLVVTAFIMGIVVVEIQQSGIIPADSLSSLLVFTIKIGLLTMFAIKSHQSLSSSFNGLSIG